MPCPQRQHRGFTLTELLVVIGLIVLLVSIAIPSFRLLSGTNSLENATNTVSASLTAARAQALGQQQTRGILFYRDPVTDRIAMTMIERKYATTWATGVAYSQGDYVLDGTSYYVCISANTSIAGNKPPNATYWRVVSSLPFPSNRPVFDVVNDFNTLLLPKGVGCVGAGTPTAGADFIYPAAILFDANGAVSYELYYLLQAGIVGSRFDLTAANPAIAGGVYSWFSQVGLMIFENELAKNSADPNQWITDNAMPLLVNRYNGTILKGE